MNALTTSLSISELTVIRPVTLLMANAPLTLPRTILYTISPLLPESMSVAVTRITLVPISACSVTLAVKREAENCGALSLTSVISIVTLKLELRPSKLLAIMVSSYNVIPRSASRGPETVSNALLLIENGMEGRSDSSVKVMKELMPMSSSVTIYCSIGRPCGVSSGILRKDRPWTNLGQLSLLSKTRMVTVVLIDKLGEPLSLTIMVT